MKKDKSGERLEAKNQKMREMLESYPDLDHVFGFTDSSNQIFKILYILIEHSQALNKLTIWLIVLTAILSVMTAISLAS